MRRRGGETVIEQGSEVATSNESASLPATRSDAIQTQMVLAPSPLPATGLE